jgi:hypothetical protein
MTTPSTLQTRNIKPNTLTETPFMFNLLLKNKKMYVFGQSKSTDIDQMLYTPTRIQDLQTLDLPTVGSTGIKIYDAMRIFIGDNPSRQFECGQQRKGTTIAFVESM